MFPYFHILWWKRLLSILRTQNVCTGFPNRTDSNISFDNLTRTFSISPSVSQFDFYINGRRFVKFSTVNKQISDVEGMHYLYFDSSGVLQETISDDHEILYNNAYVVAIYWNATDSKSEGVNDERHSTGRNPHSHIEYHERLGTYWKDGLAISGLTVDGGGSTETELQYGLTDGSFSDEDLLHTIQDGIGIDISPIATLPVAYRIGPGNWRQDAASNIPLKSFVGGSGLLAYNFFNGSTWSQVELPNSGYMCMHGYAIGNLTGEVVVFQGINSYGTIIEARAGSQIEIKNMSLDGYFSPEWIPLFTLIVQSSTAYSNSKKARYRSVDTGITHIDWRFPGGSKLLIFKAVG